MDWEKVTGNVQIREHEAVMFIHDVVVQLLDQGYKWHYDEAKSIIKKMNKRGWTIDIAEPETSKIRQYLSRYGSDSRQWPHDITMQLCDELEVIRRKERGWVSAITRKWNRISKRRTEVNSGLQKSYVRCYGQEQALGCRVLTMDDKSSVTYPKHTKRKAKSGDSQQTES